MRTSQKIRKAIFPLRRRIDAWLAPPLREGGPPAGIFSETRALAEGEVAGGLLSVPQPVVPADSEVRLAGIDQQKYAGWPALWTRREDAFLAAPSLAHADAGGKICREAIYGPHGWSDPVWNRQCPRPLREMEGDFTSLISRWNDGTNYFHWLLDGLSRLVHLGNFPTDCRILVPAALPDFAVRSIELLGLTGRVVETGGEDLRLERYWFAGPTMLSGCPDPAGVGFLRTSLLSGNSPTPHRRLYIERAAPTRTLENGADVRARFERQGWEIVNPGGLSLDGQIRLFREAVAIAGVHGAALTNLLWVSPGAAVLEFMPVRRRNGCYAGISLVAGLHHRALVCPSDRRGNISIPLSGLDRELDRLR